MVSKTELIRLHEASIYSPFFSSLEHVNMVICKGEITGIIAPDDEKKELLLSLLLGRLTPTTGRRLAFYDNQTCFFGYIVNTSNLFDDMTVTDNLLWIQQSRRKIIYSDRKAHAQAEQLLKKYALNISPKQKIRFLSLAERYMLDTIKAIEILKVKMLIINNIHLLEKEEERTHLLELTKEFRALGGTVIISSILWLNAMNQAAKVYLLQDGHPIRTLFTGDDDGVYHSYVNLFLENYMQFSVGAIMSLKNSNNSPGPYAVKLLADKNEEQLYILPKQGVLGIYTPRIFNDLDIEHMLSNGRLSFWRQGKSIPAAAISDLFQENIGYFPKHIENIIFYQLSFQENVEIFAYKKLCKIPGIINFRMEKYFINHCVAADEQLKTTSNMLSVKHHIAMQTAMKRYEQKKWELIIIHVPVFVYDTLEYHLMQNFITNMVNNGTSVLLFSNDKRILARFSTVPFQSTPNYSDSF